MNSCWSWNDAVGVDVRICRAKSDGYLGSELNSGNSLIFSRKPNYGLIPGLSAGCSVPKCVAAPDNSCQSATPGNSLIRTKRRPRLARTMRGLQRAAAENLKRSDGALRFGPALEYPAESDKSNIVKPHGKYNMVNPISKALPKGAVSVDSDIARAWTLPSHLYTEPAVFAAEKEANLCAKLAGGGASRPGGRRRAITSRRSWWASRC